MRSSDDATGRGEPFMGQAGALPPALLGQRVATQLFDLVQAVLRAGSRQLTSSVDEAIRELQATVQRERLPNLARAIDRLERQLAPETPTADLAFTLCAIGELAQRLHDEANPELVAEMVRDETNVRLLGQRELFELGRLRPRGTLTWEYRVLLDQHSGELLREEGPVRSETLSRGPSGRTLNTSLGNVFSGMGPRRVSVLQYEYRPAASQAELARALTHATSNLAPPTYILENPLSLCYLQLPIFIAPRTVSANASGALAHDERGDTLALVDDGQPGVCDALLELTEAGARPRGIAGVLLATRHGVALCPWSVIVEQADGLRWAQLAV